MRKWFLLNRVQMDGTRISVYKTVIFTPPIFPDPTESPLALSDVTPTRTEFAPDCPSLERSEVGRKLCLNEALLGRLTLGDARKAKEACCRKQTEACTAKPEKLPFRQLSIGNQLIRYQTAHVSEL